MKHYDIIVIGAGPAGYVAAIRATQLGLKTACVDNWCNRLGQPSLGGTYLNAGCIPAIALLESSRLFHLINHSINEHGIHVQNISLNVNDMIKRKEEIVVTLNQQIAQVFASNNITSIHAHGQLLENKHVGLTPLDNTEPTTISADHIILATGSVSIGLPCAQIDNFNIIDSTTALNLTEVPNRLGIIGAGVIGFELGGIWNRLGSEVTLLEAQDHFLANTDQQIAGEAFRLYSQQGLDIHLGARVTGTKKNDDKVIVEFQEQGELKQLELDKLIVATGRVANTDNLATQEAGLFLNDDGSVHVDENCITNLPGVYAIGDLTQLGPMLAHKGLEEGVFIAEHIAGHHSPINYDVIPSVIYTAPEIAWVGQTEQALKTMGEKIKTGEFSLKYSGRAQAIGQTEGLVKIISHAETDLILGVHIIGNNASELIAEAVLAMEFSASAEDLARTIHADPSYSEALHEAALAIDNRALHLPRKNN